MADITTRSGKGSPLTNDELDANFENLNSDKAEVGANTDITSLGGVTGGVSEVDYVDFDIDAASGFQVGRVRWNDSEKCLEVDVSETDQTSTTQLGQELVVYAYNADDSPILNGDVVYLHSSAGEIAAVKKFIADDSIDPRLVIGMATQDIPLAGFGLVCRSGYVRGLDTSAFQPADEVFASSVTAGGISSSRPVSPDRVVDLGICLESDSTNGIILVQVDYAARSESISYSNADSNLTATNVKSAIDELDLVKADISIIQSNVTFYLTNANEGVIPTYKHLVTTTIDPDFDDVAVDFVTPSISSTPTLCGSWISDPDVLTGDVAGIVIPFVANVRKDSGSGDPAFYIEVYIRDDLGAETLLTTSNSSDNIATTSYVQISLAANISLQNFTDTDRVVVKLYGITVSSTALAEVQLGGVEPSRALFPVPVSVIPNVASASEIIVDTSGFGGVLSGTDDSVQAALDTLDDHGHPIGDITGLTTSNIDTNTSNFDGLLSVADDDIQKALNTLDETGLSEVTGVNATTTNAITINAALDVDNINIDANTISTTDLNGDLTLAPNGTGAVVMTNATITGGSLDGVSIGATAADEVTATVLTAISTVDFSGVTVSDLGTVTTADINGGTIDGVTLQASIASIDNVKIDGNLIEPIVADTNGTITIQGRGTGTVVLPGADINGGTLDGVIIGGASAAAATVTNLTASGSINFSGATISDLGTVTTADINGGTIDDVDITVPFGSTLDITTGTLLLADDAISGDKINGGTISNFRSAGIDDNANALAIILDVDENVLAQRATAETSNAIVQAEDGFAAMKGTSAGLNLVSNEVTATLTEGVIGTQTTHPLNIQTDGTNAIVISALQDVGIGAATPDYKLHVENSGGDVAVGITSSITGSSTLNMGDTGDGTTGQIVYNNNLDTMTLQAGSADTLVLDSTSATVNGSLTATGALAAVNTTITGTLGVSLAATFSNDLTVDSGTFFVDASANTVNMSGDLAVDTDTLFVDVSAGNVGVGTATPTRALDVIGSVAVTDTGGGTLFTALGAGSDSFLIKSESDLIALDTRNTLGGLAFQMQGTERMRIDSAGNVGIGDSSPEGQLTVIGIGGDDADVASFRGGPSAAALHVTGYSNSPQNRVYLSHNSYRDSTTAFQYDNPAQGSSYLNFNDGFMAFGVDAANAGTPVAPTERMRIDSAGNVGIGTNSPYNGLTIETAGGNFTDGLVLQSSNATSQGSGITWNFSNSTNEAARIQCNRSSNSGNAHTGLVFSTAASFSVGPVVERMRIDSAGNVGINTTSANAPLHVNGGAIIGADGTAPAQGWNVGLRGSSEQTTSALSTTGGLDSSLWAVESLGNSVGSGGGVMFGARQGRFAAIKGLLFSGSNNTAGHLSFSTRRVNTNATLTEAMRIDYSGNVGIGITDPSDPLTVGGASLRVTNTDVTRGLKIGIETGGSSRSQNGVRFTAGDSFEGEFYFSQGNGTERMRINRNGQLLVGITTVPDGTANGVQAHPAGILRTSRTGTTAASHHIFYNTNGDVGSIDTSGTSTSYTTASDYRLKNIFGPITSSGSYIDSLNPVEGTWKSDGSTFVGLIAHEVQEASRTNVATGEKDGAEMQGMDYSSAEIIANLIAEVQSLRSRVATLEG